MVIKALVLVWLIASSLALSTVAGFAQKSENTAGAKASQETTQEATQENVEEIEQLSTLERIRARGSLICGASNNSPGFAEQDENNRWYGFDVDFCRALAAAIFNDSSRVEFRALDGNARYVELKSGDIDVFARNASWTMTRDLTSQVHYVGTSFFDGQSLLVPNNNDLVSALDLDDQSICVQEGSESQSRLRAFFSDNQIMLNEQSFEDARELPAAYKAGVCTAISANLIELHNYRLLMETPSDHKMLPEIMSKNLFGPVVRANDDNWTNIVRWTLFSLINAEELGVSSTNVSTMIESRTPAIRRLLGVEGDLATNLGLEKDWVRNMVEQVGNYGELFNRNLGPDTSLSMQRGLNALWNQGGLIYAPPVR